MDNCVKLNDELAKVLIANEVGWLGRGMVPDLVDKWSKKGVHICVDRGSEIYNQLAAYGLIFDGEEK